MARIRSTLALSLGTITCFAFAQLAAAQTPKPKAKPKDAPQKPIELDAPLPGDAPAAGPPAGAGSGSAGATVEMTDDKPSEDPTGTRENPNAPRVVDDESVGVRTGAPPAERRTGYPIEEVLRPITLPANTSEVALDLRSAFDKADAEGTLRARYGITRQIQIGLLYGIGGVFAEDGVNQKTKFNTGKAAGVDGAFLLTDWVALHARVPIYMQPFAMGVTLGAPMKFRFGDQIALFALDNVIDITLYNKFMPSLVDERGNRNAANLSMTNTLRNDGNLRFVGGGIYQLDHKTAIIGSLGMLIPNFDGSAKYPLEGAVQWSPSNKLDIAGRLGFDSLGEAKSTFGIRITAAFRI